MAEGKNTEYGITMKIHPEIFEELGVRDPDEIKRETAIVKKTRQVQKELQGKQKSFSALAQEFSLGPEAIRGGDLGYFEVGQMPEEFDDVFKLKIGKYAIHRTVLLTLVLMIFVGIFK